MLTCSILLFPLFVVDIKRKIVPKLDGLSEQAKRTAKFIEEDLPDLDGDKHHFAGHFYTDDDPEPKFGEDCPSSCTVSIRKMMFFQAKIRISR